ncbi:MAG: cyclodeaminase/cyclohydrolase family protein [Firmicutes bacterium]|nr:cyclodeaminase/cyclohydrolase family protein [Bacillota bacterium]MBQ2042002.1 cyclodeaminase/cyclohydrolase family protein [Bacillota bacterium]
MSMNDLSVRAFTDELAAKVSVPGGGGASALVGALASALGSMVGNFTLGKKKYADVEPEIIRLMDKAAELQNKLLACIDKDAEGFEPLSRAYGLPKDAPGRDETLEKCLRDAAAVPFEIAELAAEVIAVQEEFAKKGSKLMVSDAGCGAAFARAALEGAVLNVRVNTKLMKDREYAANLDARVDELLAAGRRDADAVYAFVLDGLK